MYPNFTPSNLFLSISMLSEPWPTAVRDFVV
uniref:Uncharacterized protein n=1 Tax=Rhizophora mucronata TaxID=61149 RepID=A0A2P2P8L0_RHIMU